MNNDDLYSPEISEEDSPKENLIYFALNILVAFGLAVFISRLIFLNPDRIIAGALVMTFLFSWFGRLAIPATRWKKSYYRTFVGYLAFLSTVLMGWSTLSFLIYSRFDYLHLVASAYYVIHLIFLLGSKFYEPQSAKAEYRKWAIGSIVGAVTVFYFQLPSDLKFEVQAYPLHFLVGQLLPLTFLISNLLYASFVITSQDEDIASYERDDIQTPD